MKRGRRRGRKRRKKDACLDICHKNNPDPSSCHVPSPYLIEDFDIVVIVCEKLRLLTKFTIKFPT